MYFCYSNWTEHLQDDFVWFKSCLIHYAAILHVAHFWVHIGTFIYVHFGHNIPVKHTSIPAQCHTFLMQGRFSDDVLPERPFEDPRYLTRPRSPLTSKTHNITTRWPWKMFLSYLPSWAFQHSAEDAKLLPAELLESSKQHGQTMCPELPRNCSLDSGEEKPRTPKPSVSYQLSTSVFQPMRFSW